MNRRDTLSALLALGAATGSLGVRGQFNSSMQSKTLAARSLGYEVRYHFLQKSEDVDPAFDW